MHRLHFIVLLLSLAMAPFHQTRAEDKPAAKEAKPSVAPEAALQRLMEGNQRMRSGRPIHPNLSKELLAEAAVGQNPFAVVLTCSDSRLPPEVIFDQGIGDIFVVRLAGNILTPEGLASMEYAVKVLGSRLIMVLGHSACGAVDAALKGGELPGHIGSLTQAIKPAIKGQCETGDKLNCAIRANVNYIVKRLAASEPIVAKAVADKRIQVVGAFFDIAPGEVTILSSE